MLLNDHINRTSACMLNKLKLSPQTVYGQNYGFMKVIRDYCPDYSKMYYNPALPNRFLRESEEQQVKGKIKLDHYLGKRKCLERLSEYYNTGMLSWTMHKLKQKCRLFDGTKLCWKDLCKH